MLDSVGEDPIEIARANEIAQRQSRQTGTILDLTVGRDSLIDRDHHASFCLPAESYPEVHNSIDRRHQQNEGSRVLILIVVK